MGLHVIQSFLSKQSVNVDVVHSLSAVFGDDEVAVVEVRIVAVELFGGGEFVVVLCELRVLLGFGRPLSRCIQKQFRWEGNKFSPFLQRPHHLAFLHSWPVQ